MSLDDQDRRFEERISARLEVRFGGEQEAAKALRVFSENFSTGGLCIRTQRTYELGEVLDFTMRVGEETYELEGVVAWKRAGAVGLRFERVSTDDRRRLAKLYALLKGNQRL